MKFSTITFLLLVSAFGVTQAQVFPLSENSWQNPEFVKRFLGSYGVNTRVEPEISREEGTLFNELVDIIGTSPEIATERLRVTITPTSSAALDYTLGSLLLQAGDFSGSIANYQRAIRKFPNFMRAYKNLGLAFIQSGDFDSAIPMLVKAIELGDGDGGTYGLLGFAYLNIEKPRSALDAYRIATVLSPENRDWKIGLTQALNLTEDHIQSAALLKELLEENPTQTSLWSSRANSLVAMGREMQAASHLEVIKRQNKANGAILRLLGDIYLNSGMPQLAVQNYSAALSSSGQISLSVAIQTTRNLLMFGAIDESDDFLKSVYERFDFSEHHQERVALLNISAEISLSRGDDSGAAQILEEVIAEDPLNGQALLLLGNYHNRSGDIEEAVYFYERAATISGVQIDALIQHARLLVSNRNYADAVVLLERAQSIRASTNVENYLNAVRSARDVAR